jgi:membrane protein
LVKDTVKAWSEDNVPRLGAALAFYTLLSLAPLLVVATAVAGLTFGEQAARGQLVAQIKDSVGPEGAAAIQTMLANAYHPAAGIWATVLSGVVLLVGATGLFAELQGTLNTIWGVEPKGGSGVWGAIKGRLLSFVLVLFIGLLLLALVVLSAVLAAAGRYAGDVGLPDGVVLRVLDFAVSLGVATLLFAAIYKVLPDAHIRWGDVWVGALVTACLFTLGKYLIGLYLGQSSVASSYGAAGSLAVFLIWVYYSTQILLLGAEFTKVYAGRCGRSLEPKANAVPCPRPRSAATGTGRAGAPRRVMKP